VSELSIIAVIVGGLLVLGGLSSVLKPETVRRGLRAYPRSVWPGRMLATVDLAGAAYAFSFLHLGPFDPFKIHLWWIAPVAIWLTVVYLDELLSVRALGGLLLLVASPVLAVARWHPSAWRLVISVLAYLWILSGLIFLLAPWWFRRLALAVTARDVFLRAAGTLKTVFGFGLVALAIWVF